MRGKLEEKKKDSDLAVCVGRTRKEQVTAIHLEMMKGNLKIEAGKILLHVKKPCTDVFNRGQNHSYRKAYYYGFLWPRFKCQVLIFI